MDGVSNKFILDLNSQILKPDLQLAIFADEDILQKRLSERDALTRFEKNNQSNNELCFMKAGLIELEKQDINIMCIDNNDKLEANAEKIVSYIDENWKKQMNPICVDNFSLYNYEKYYGSILEPIKNKQF